MLRRSSTPVAQPARESLVSSTVWLMLSQGIRLGLQAVYFVIIARSLGPDQYGAFVGATALVSVLAPFASLGSGNLLVKNVSRDRSLFSQYWGNALVMIGVSGTGLVLLASVAAQFFLPESISLLLIVAAAIADLICHRITLTSAQAFQAVFQLRQTALINILPHISRVFAALALIRFFPSPNAVQWTCLYLLGTCCSALTSIYLVTRALGKAKPALWRIRPELKEGCYFSVGLSSKTIYNDLDKTMLSSLTSLQTTGLYAAAYRLIDVSFVPIMSLLGASYSRFFRQGKDGIRGSLRLARKLTPIAVAYGLAVGALLYFVAPLVEYAFGEDYAGTVTIIRWLALLPCLKALHYFAADTLTGAGFQGMRSSIQIAIALFNLGLNFWLIPQFSWRGAVWSSLASDALLALSLWVSVCVLCARAPKPTPGQVQP